MHIFISGASGRNGQIALNEALDRGHTITALVRNPESLAAHANLTIIQGTMNQKEADAKSGDPSSQTDIQKALSTPHLPSAILTTLNPRRTTENIFSSLSPDSPPNLLTFTAQALLSAIENLPFTHPPSLVINSLFGAGSSWRNLSLPLRLVMRHSTMRLTIEDHNDMDALVRASGLPFVLVRPTRLVQGPATEVKVWPADGAGCGWNPSISRECWQMDGQGCRNERVAWEVTGVDELGCDNEMKQERMVGQYIIESNEFPPTIDHPFLEDPRPGLSCL